MLPVSLDCPFLIGPSVFSHVYVYDFIAKCLLSSSVLAHYLKQCTRGINILISLFCFNFFVDFFSEHKLSPIVFIFSEEVQKVIGNRHKILRFDFDFW